MQPYRAVAKTMKRQARAPAGAQPAQERQRTPAHSPSPLSALASSHQQLLRTATAHHELERSDRNAASLDPVGGRPLPRDLRSYFEPRFAHDFSAVRLHDDAHAATAAERINAKAFTLGNSIGFGRGHFAPHTAPGRELLAHELAHVVQQSRGPGSPAPGANPGVERDAHQAARAATSSTGIAQVRAASGVGIARDGDDKTPFWKRRLNPIFQKALQVLPPAGAATLEQLNEAARKFVEEKKITDAQLDSAARAIEPVVVKVEAALNKAELQPTTQTPPPAPKTPTPSKATAKPATPTINLDNLSPQARKEIEDAAQNWAEIDLAFKEGELLDGDQNDYLQDPDYVDQFEGTPDYDGFTKTVLLKFKDGKSYVLPPKIVRALLESGTASPSPVLLFHRNVFNHKITPNNLNRSTTPRLVQWFADNREVIENSDLLLAAGQGTATIAQKRISNRLMLETMGANPLEIATTKILDWQVEGDPDLEQALAVYQILKLPVALAQGPGRKSGRGTDEPEANTEANVPGVKKSSSEIELDTSGKPLGSGQVPAFNERDLLGGASAEGSFGTGAKGPTELVWLNTETNIYHYGDSRYFGNTKAGRFMPESEALKNPAVRAARPRTPGEVSSYTRISQEAGRLQEKVVSDITGWPKNNTPHSTAFGDRIPDYLPTKHPTTNAWVTAGRPEDALFVADSKYYDERVISLNDQIRGFVEIASRTKPPQGGVKMLIFFTNESARISPEVFTWGSTHGVTVRQIFQRRSL